MSSVCVDCGSHDDIDREDNLCGECFWRRKVEALQKHYDAAGPEHNLLALLDLYFDRKMEAEDMLEAWRPVVEAAIALVANEAGEHPIATTISDHERLSAAVRALPTEARP